MIDLHLHTTASDGRLSPAGLVERVAAAGITVMAVTDHDTIAAVRDVQRHAAARGIHAIEGIEITAVEDGRDIHVLGYFVQWAQGSPLPAFLGAQRGSRVDRVEAIGRRLAELGRPVDLAEMIAAAKASNGRSIGRPQIARAMIDAGYINTVQEAFDHWLGIGCPAFVPRTGPGIEGVIDVIHRSGGLASLAHPGRTRIDGRIGPLRDAGLDAIEVYHSDHEPQDVERYDRLARDLGLLATGGSDFHGDPARTLEPGAASLPPAAWTALDAARQRHAAGG